MKNRPKVGISVIVIKDGQVLIGKRKQQRGKGTWGFPGGHLEYGETFEQCINREMREEADISVSNIKFQTLTNDINSDERTHYITLFFTADYESGDVKNMEPRKCEGWKWVLWEKLPTPLFLSIRNLLKQNFHLFPS